MKLISDFTRSRQSMASTLQLWLVYFTFAGLAALLIAALQHADAALSKPPLTTTAGAASATSDRPSMHRTENAAAFAGAAESLRTGRYAEAYGRFVALADEGDVESARIALVMHRFGPDVFGSDWDASVEQIEAWTLWSAAAAEKELACLRGGALGLGANTDTHRQVSQLAAVTRCR